MRDNRERKTESIKIRLTKGEYDMIMQKSTHYPSMAAMIITAVEDFNASMVSNKLQVIYEFTEYLKNYIENMESIYNKVENEEQAADVLQEIKKTRIICHSFYNKLSKLK